MFDVVKLNRTRFSLDSIILIFDEKLITDSVYDDNILNVFSITGIDLKKV